MREQNRNLAVRVVTALVLFPFAVWMTWLGGPYFAILIALVSALSAGELVWMFEKRLRPTGWLGVLGAAAVPVGAWLWNQGGMGIGNDNIKNAFGKMEVFGNDSVQLCIIDEDDERIACYTVKNSIVPTGIGQNNSDGSALSLFPNPVQQQLQLNISLTDPAENIIQIGIFDVSGKLVLRAGNANRQQTISVAGLASGLYAVRVETEHRQLSQLFVKE